MASRNQEMPAWVGVALIFIFLCIWLVVAYFAGWQDSTEPFGLLK